MLLLVSGSLLLQAPLMVKAQEFSDDPVVQAKIYLDRNTVIHNFNPSKNYSEVVDFLSKKTYEDSGAIVFANLQVGENQIDIPVQFTKNLNETDFTKSYETAKQGLLETIKSIKEKPETKTEVQKQENDSNDNEQGGINYNLVEASDKINLDQINTSKTNSKDIKFSKVSYVVTSNNQEISKIDKDNTNSKSNNSKLNEDRKEDKKIFKKKSTNTILSSEVIKPTEEYKKKVLAQAQETKEGIARKENERFIGETVIKPLKEKAIKEQQKKQKQKAKEVKKLIKEGKKDQIKLTDIYELGEESLKMGLEIKVPEIKPNDKDLNNSEKQPKIQIDETKVINYQEDKQIGLLDSILNFESIKVEAFSPEYTNTNVPHAKPGAHFGTALDLYGGYTYNGSDIGLWYNNGNNSWNQKFDFYSDSTIRVGGKCVDLNGNNAYNGAKIQLWECNGGNAQKWVLDTDGLIRLKYNNGYCIDANSGSAGQKIYLWACGGANWTESFRPSYYEMGLMNRKPNAYYPNLLDYSGCYSKNPPDCGHTFVYMAKYDNYNYLESLSTFSKWNVIDNLVNNINAKKAYFDQNSNLNTNIHFNNNSDLNDAFNLTNNNSYGAYAFWRKPITYNQWYNTTYGGFKNGYVQGYATPGWSNPFYWDWCTTYARNLWQNNGGMSLAGITPSPQDYQPVLLSIYAYD